MTRLAPTTLQDMKSDPTMASSAPLRPGIHGAVNSAIDTSATDLDPSLVSKITEHVVSALKKEMLTSSATQPTPHSSRSGRTRASSSAAHQTTQYHSYPNHDNNAPLYQPTPVHAREAIPSPPTSPASSHLPARYTPPSPGRYGASSRGSTSPEPLYSDAGSGSRRGSRSSTSGKEEKRSSSRMRPTTIPLANLHRDLASSYVDSQCISSLTASPPTASS